MRTNLAQLLIAEERRLGNESDGGSHAAFRVCEKLRDPLCLLAGVGGYRSLLSRALVLAKGEAPILGGIQIKQDGSLGHSVELEAQLHTEEAAKAGAILARQLVDLLITFIGEALTLRLVQGVWPNAALNSSKSGGKQS